MALETNDYLSQLCRNVAQLVNDILGEKSIPLFRRAPQVLLTAPFQTSTDYHLNVTRRELGDDDNGTFTAPNADGSFLVFRNPARLRVGFLLVSPALAPDSRLAAYDRLTTYFFDNRSLPAYVPASFDRYPALADKLRAAKAELRATVGENITPNNGFTFAFDYSALYHSGNPLRSEARVQTRSLLFPKEARERSIP